MVCLLPVLVAALAAPPSTLPPAIQAERGAFHPAEPADYIATVRNFAAAHPADDLLRGVVALDLNGDGVADYGVLAVDRTTRDFRFLLAVSRADGTYAFSVRHTYRGAFPQRGGIVYTCMQAKPAGSALWADKHFSKLAPNTPARAAYEAGPALGLWKSLGEDPYHRPDDYEASSLSFCRDVYFGPGGKLQSILVCE